MKYILSILSCMCLLHMPLSAQEISLSSHTGTRVTCTNGYADAYACDGIDLLARLAMPDYEAGIDTTVWVTDIWGWTDPETERDYALAGRYDAVSFVDVTDPVNPVFIGFLPSHDEQANSFWRDMKVYKNHMFVTVDGTGANGVQVFDLTRLREYAGEPIQFEETAQYDGVATVHNIAINEETGFAYATGSGGGAHACGPGLHMIDIQDPVNPSFEGCFNDETTGAVIGGAGYTHDAQCVIYEGPDPEHQGKEICFGSNENALSVADVTDKANPVALSATTYPNSAYAHQGWLTENHAYFIMNDELDEYNFGDSTWWKGTRTLIWDVADLDDPVLRAEYTSSKRSVDHNLFVVGNYVVQGNYTAGVRVLDISDIENPYELAYFDTHPENDDISFNGVWAAYPFFKSGVMVANSTPHGLFVLQPTSFNLVRTSTEELERELPDSFVLDAARPNPFNPSTTLTLRVPNTQHVRVAAFDVMGREVATVYKGVLETGTHDLQFNGGHLPSSTYLIVATGTLSLQTQLVTLVK